MKIAIDLDEVLAEYLASFLEFHNKKHGTDLKKHHFSKTYKVEEVLGETEEEMTERIYHFYKTEDFKKIKPSAGSIKAIQKLKKNHELFIVTSRQNHVSAPTIEWINKHFPDSFSGILFGNHFSKEGPAKAKSEICKEIGAEILIDDSLDYAKECAGKGIKVLLFDHPWNQAETLPKNIQRVYSWQEILKIIK